MCFTTHIHLSLISTKRDAAVFVSLSITQLSAERSV
jgi:hypothetical protein